jgi:homocysteine S-methyltransferase
MSKPGHDLSLSLDSALLTDGGLETTLVFHEGIDLPHFAAFPLVDTAEGRRALARYYGKYLRLAAERGLGFVLDTPTWRANPDWAPLLGYDLTGLARVNQDSVAFVAELRDEWGARASPILLDGVIGPRGDGYKDGTMDPAAAEDYHGLQAEAFAGAGVDLVSAITMTTVGEAVGIARAAKTRGLPHVISFTVETDGRLVGGTTLREAIERTDEATGGSPAWYMVNCAHPLHFADAIGRGEAWATRIGGLRANASTLSHAQLDEATELDDGDPEDLGARYAVLRRALPSIRVLGGCCGTDHRHVEAIAVACKAR